MIQHNVNFKIVKFLNLLKKCFIISNNIYLKNKENLKNELNNIYNL